MERMVLSLPRYPSFRSRQSLPPSQLATVNIAILASLGQVINLPPAKRDTPSTSTFLATYAKDHAQQVLHELIWGAGVGGGTENMTKIERTIHQRVLLLAEKVALSGNLDLQILIDLSVVFGQSNPKRTKSLLSACVSTDAFSAKLTSQVENDVVPAFTTLLAAYSDGRTDNQGLYGLRKIAHVLLSFLRSAPSTLVRPFSVSKQFMVVLAKAYDAGLSLLAQSYGGVRVERFAVDSVEQLDDWERIWLETKVALVDTFHAVLRTLLKDVADVPDTGPTLAARCDAAFEVVFGLLDVPSSTPSSSSTPEPTPFVNRPLLADYQHMYDLSKTFRDLTERVDDARTELVESALRTLDAGGAEGQSSTGAHAKPGVLRLLIRSSGVPPGIDNLGKGTSHPETSKDKGKGKAVVPAQTSAAPKEGIDPALDAAVVQVLDILSDQSPAYVRFLLAHTDYPYHGDAERLIGALLEGTAPGLEEVESAMARAAETGSDDQVAGFSTQSEHAYTVGRRNVFDAQEMDLSQVRIGKKREDASVLLRDKSFMEQMKADILRRAEEISDSEDEDEEGGRNVDVAFEDDVDEVAAVRVRDGDSSDDDDEGGDGDDTEEQPKGPETILELAYIRDPKLFDRDGETRRGRARADLKAQIGWTDEQIEGWRIMLERNPKKDKILQKHEFAGNKPGIVDGPASTSQHPLSLRGGRGGGRGRGQGPWRGRGRGRGGAGAGGSGGGGGEQGGGDSRDRARKDRFKASRANHNRKRGHDKKMARAGGPS